MSKDESLAARVDTEREVTADKRLVTFALMLAMAVAALEQTVVSTAMPSIVSELKGVRIYPWVSSAYLLAFTITTPLYGKLADVLGRKRVLMFGLMLFLLGSGLSGLSQNMPFLIMMRIVQGLGFGAIMPIVLTIIGDLFTLDERARVQGWFSAVWAASGLLGPILGGILTDYASWRWVFFVTIPFGLVAMWVLGFCFHERVPPAKAWAIDWMGAALLAVTSSALLLALLGRSVWDWQIRAALAAVFVMGLVGFVLWELRSSHPILPVDLFATRTVSAAMAGSFVIGSLLFVIEVYLPLYVQGVDGGTAFGAGTRLAPLLVTWSLSVVVAARAVLRFGFRSAALVGSVAVTAGMAALALGAALPQATDALFFVGMVVIGLGMGPTALSYILAVQSSVSWAKRGIATGTLSYFRTMGGAIVVAALGAVVAAGMASQLPKRIDVSSALRPETHDVLKREDLELVRSALRSSLRDVFAASVVISSIGLACAARLPRTVDPHAGSTGDA